MHTIFKTACSSTGRNMSVLCRKKAVVSIAVRLKIKKTSKISMRELPVLRQSVRRNTVAEEHAGLHMPARVASVIEGRHGTDDVMPFTRVVTISAFKAASMCRNGQACIWQTVSTIPLRRLCSIRRN